VRLKKEVAARKYKAVEGGRQAKAALNEKNMLIAYKWHIMDPKYLWVDDVIIDLEENGTEWMPDDSPLATCYWRYLHKLPYADFFDDICQSNPDLPSLLFDFAHESILRSKSATTMLQDFIFTADTKAYNLTRLTKTNDLLRFLTDVSYRSMPTRCSAGL